jgi:hypothetical protein
MAKTKAKTATTATSVKLPVQPDGPKTCPEGYILINGVCVLNVGG